MRIRKNNSAKISSLLYATNLKPPAGPVINHQSIISHVVVTTNCELNQSPWDVMTTFSPPSSPPPPPPQVSKTSDASGIDEYSSSVDTISISERKELNDAGETETVWYNYDDGTDKATAGPLPTTCCKTDGKSWQCRKKAAPGSSMCQHHLPLTKSYTKKPTEASQCRPRRPKKASGSSTSTNPYEFYYYSGFGPRWGKRRGGVGDDTTNGCVITKTVHYDHQEMEPSLSSSHIIKDDSNYVEYEDDEEDEEEEINEKKRARKPIKARSLKSLM